MYSTATVILALLFVVILLSIGVCARGLGRKENEHILTAKDRLRKKKSTDFLDRNKVDDSCDICFGEFENGRVAVCECGMRFHLECAKLTEECPYCKRAFDTMKVREIRKPKCPYCGEEVEKNICRRCNTVLPNKDMRFECVCGETVLASDGVCPRCGAEFEFTYEGPSKRK